MAKKPRKERVQPELAKYQPGKTRLLISAQRIGAIIGKHGSGLQHIKTSCNVKVEVLPPTQTPQWPEDQMVILQGSVASRQQGADAVLRAAFSSTSTTPLSSGCQLKIFVQIPKNESVDDVLGRVTGACGVKVQVCGNASEELGEQLVAVEGNLPQVCAALSIFGLLESTPQLETAQAATEQAREKVMGSPRLCGQNPRSVLECAPLGRARGRIARSSRGRGGRG
jgi:hypothetical protein